MAAEQSKANENQLLEKCIDALQEKDRSNYAGEFVQGFVHNANGPLQNLTMLTEMVISGIELQDRIFRSSCGEDEKWAEILEKQRRRLAQMRDQIFSLAGDLREFMHIHETERSGTEIDINALLTRIVKIFRSDLFFKHQVKHELRLAKNLPHIKAPGKDVVPAFFNLFHNSITAMKESPKKELIIETEMLDGQIVVRMIDSGCGIGAEHDPEAFFALFDSKWPHRQTEGDSRGPHLGFGLYAARRLLAPYGFTVTLEPRDEGALTVVCMPLPPGRE